MSLQDLRRLLVRSPDRFLEVASEVGAFLGTDLLRRGDGDPRKIMTLLTEESDH